MKTEGGNDDAKRRAGEAAAAVVEDGMTVGLGTGSTAAHAIRAIGRAVDSGLDIRGVPTSFAARELAREQAIPLVPVADVERIDLSIDGADQLVPATGACIKGGGAAHAREKIVAAAADRLSIVVDPSKTVDVLERSVPIEVLPAARTTVAAAVAALDGEATLRRAAHKDGPVVTDNGNLVLDCSFGSIDNPAALATELASLPGVLEHGLFVGLTDMAYVGTATGVDRIEIDR